MCYHIKSKLNEVIFPSRWKNNENKDEFVTAV